VSSFVPLHADHARYNVIVDLGALRPFRFSSAAASTEFAYADYQTNCDINPRGRLGSGRSVCFSGKYIKGVGRTPLAANWADPDDEGHNNGSLSTSAAVREYLATCYLQSRGLGHTIVPCEGLLLRRRSRTCQGSELWAGRGRLAPIDRLFHALSVKPAGFARMSNFVWSVDRVGREPAALFTLLRRVLEHSVGPGGSAPLASESSPATIAQVMRDAARRGLGHFDDFLRAGVFWGSLHNNVTGDGRLLDLETPMITGGPVLGAIHGGGSDRPPPGAPPTWIGLESLGYLSQVRDGLLAFSDRIAAVGRRCASVPVVHQFCSDLADALNSAVAELIEEPELRARLADRIGHLLELSPSRCQRLAAALMARAGGKPSLPVRWRRLAIEFADIEPARLTNCLVPTFAPPRKEALELARVVNHNLLEVERQTTLRGVFAAVTTAERLIRRECTRVPLPE